ncbi:MAG: PEP-CTERM sorting domain-containing protein [bacterium]
MVSKMLSKLFMAASLWALSTTGAWALSLTITSGGLTAANANYGCPTGSSLCQTNADFALSAPANASGTIDINAAGTIATINLYVGSVSFSPTGAGSPITFAAATYSGTVNVLSGTGFVSSVGPGAGSLSGTVGGSPFSASPSISILNCSVSGSTALCGITFGKAGFTNVADHDWVHTFNVSATSNPVPEPTTALLVVLGAAGLLFRARRS